MSLRNFKIHYIVILLLSFCSLSSKAGIEIKFWHSMAGNLGRTLDKIIEDFNKQNPSYNIISVYKGTYPETLTSTVAAFRAGYGPDIVQIFDIATATMIHPKGVIKPMYKIFKETNTKLNTEQFVRPIVDYYSNSKGKLLAAPFNISTPMLFYNKEHFIQAGLDPNVPPKTWLEVEEYAKKILEKSEATCGFSSTWIGWALFESFSLIHNLPYATANNGFDSLDVKISFNNDETKRFINRLYDLQSKRVFVYGGRIDDAQSFFTSGKCAMLIQSSGAFADLEPSVSFPLGMTRVPYLEDYQESELGNLIGGAAIWAMASLSKDKYGAIADFVKYLCSPKVQKYWQNNTGYISVVREEFLPKDSKVNPNASKFKEIQDFVISREKKYKGIRLGNYMQIRDLVERQLEAIWAGYSSVDESLDLAEVEANRMLKRFKRNVN